MSQATICLTLGHDGLIIPVSAARSSVRSVLATHGADILATFPHGEGTWEGENGPLYETCDAWLVSIPTANVPHVRTCLAHLARKFGQDAIGCTIHDHATYGESYIPAE